MTRPKLAEQVRLQRFALDVSQLTEENGFSIWTLELPVWNTLVNCAEELKKHYNKCKKYQERQIPYLGVPLRQLNDALVTVCPSLTHGFEEYGRDAETKRKKYRALVVGTLNCLPMKPETSAIKFVLEAWVRWWLNAPYFECIGEKRLTKIKTKLTKVIHNIDDTWVWQENSVDRLIQRFMEKDTLNYDALPSLLATLLHERRTSIGNRMITWRKSHGDDGKLIVLGTENGRPIYAQYDGLGFPPKSGDGYFAYKLVFSTQTQVGRDEPWMFVSLHAQRYGHSALKKANQGRKVSILVGANHLRQDDFPIDSTLIKLKVNVRGNEREDSEDATENEHINIKSASYGDFEDRFEELLVEIGLNRELVPVIDVLTDPQSYWRPQNITEDYDLDEYYVIHAEGYTYSDENKIQPGFTMTEMDNVFSVILPYLPLLADGWLMPDPIPTPTGGKRPLAMVTLDELLERPTLKPRELGD